MSFSKFFFQAYDSAASILIAWDKGIDHYIDKDTNTVNEIGSEVLKYGLDEIQFENQNDENQNDDNQMNGNQMNGNTEDKNGEDKYGEGKNREGKNNIL